MIAPRLFVVETEKAFYLGCPFVHDSDHIVVMTGRVGNPPVVHIDDVISVELAEGHALVEM